MAVGLGHHPDVDGKREPGIGVPEATPSGAIGLGLSLIVVGLAARRRPVVLERAPRQRPPKDGGFKGCWRWTGVVNDTARSIVSRMLLALTLLAVVAVVGLSVDPFYNGDNYCGRVLF